MRLCTCDCGIQLLRGCRSQMIRMVFSGDDRVERPSPPFNISFRDYTLFKLLYGLLVRLCGFCELDRPLRTLHLAAHPTQIAFPHGIYMISQGFMVFELRRKKVYRWLVTMGLNTVFCACTAMLAHLKPLQCNSARLCGCRHPRHCAVEGGVVITGRHHVWPSFSQGLLVHVDPATRRVLGAKTSSDDCWVREQDGVGCRRALQSPRCSWYVCLIDGGTSMTSSGMSARTGRRKLV